jgi:PTH1 family peptidyl-tRNA hydrolase
LAEIAWIVAGLGNPGVRYAGTRHDLGFMLVDRLGREAGVAFARRGGCEVTPPIRLDPAGAPLVRLAKPQDFMNLSGPPLARLLAEEELAPDRLLVVVDDVNLELGRIRLRREGSAGGHGGLESAIEALGSGFPRLRLGVGRGPEGTGLKEWVLARFPAEDLPAVDDMLARAAACVRALVRDGHGAALRCT